MSRLKIGRDIFYNWQQLSRPDFARNIFMIGRECLGPILLEIIYVMIFGIGCGYLGRILLEIFFGAGRGCLG